jgi:RimJ/RimL family protein N-acetyltransferase
MIDFEKLKFRKLSYRDSYQVYLALIESGSNYLGAYLGWGRRIEKYSERAIHKTVVMDIGQPLPNEHFVVEYCGELIGFGSSGKSSFLEGVQITYWVRKKFAGQGIGMWLVSQMIDYLFFVRDRDLVEIHTDLLNIASARIPEKLGFKVFSHYRQSDNFGYESSREMTIWIKLSPRVSVLSNLGRFRIGRKYRDSYSNFRL